MDRDTYIDSLRSDLLTMVADHLTPVALRYGYIETPLESNIKWRPLVLVLGNYSSGKSAMINEFLGASIQATGQAPTDDSFTVITYDDAAPTDHGILVTEERDGKVLLNDPEYPFSILKRHGQRFSSHFRLKKVNSPFLKTLAVIDTPGMLDSITERDRGYSYQEVVGDLAQIADLILVLFDPHKAGTIREAHISLRETLPAHTFEDRVVYVLNRIDECASLEDLIRVYGTLCWNLSQITGRKDIPAIHLTYSPSEAAESNGTASRDSSYLLYLENQRNNLKKTILQAPRHRLDNLATFVETHSERLSHFLESLISYRHMLRMFRFKHSLAAFFFSIILGCTAIFSMLASESFSGLEYGLIYGTGGIVATGIFVLWMSTLLKYFTGRFHRKRLRDIDTLTPLDNQVRRDSWDAIRDFTHDYLKKTGGRFPAKEVKEHFITVREVYEKKTGEIREKIAELSTNKKKESSLSTTTAAKQAPPDDH
jgi:EH domain-containing protein 1